MIVVTGRVQAAEGQDDAVIGAAQTMCQASCQDKGCLGYRFYADTEQPGRFLFLEEWESDEDLQAHFTQPHTEEFMTAMGGLLVGAPDVSFHTIASTRRLGPNGLVDA